jgi:RimJ/RimL family protein N-acetyltransferase
LIRNLPALIEIMKARKNSFTIRPLTSSDAAVIILFLRSQPPEYLRFFYAYGSDETMLAEMLSAVEKDVHSGVFWNGELAGVFMLRGWDEGYEVPSFGVLIDEKYRGGAFMRLTLDTAKLICRLSGAKRLMAKIHPENVSPRGARRLGLLQTGVEESTGNIIYHLEL